MELEGIISLEKLKAMAYDCIAQKEQAEQALALINQRITDVENQQQLETIEKAKKAK